MLGSSVILSRRRSPIFILPATVALLDCHRATLASFRTMCAAENQCISPVVQLDTTLTPGTVHGLVVEPNFRRVVNYAQIRSHRTRSEAFASEKGEFTLTALPPGTDTLDVRFLCYRRVDIPIEVPKTGGLRMVVPLEPSGCIVQP